ncbi:hypothetical protein D3C80_1992590 [compost metagenome]
MVCCMAVLFFKFAQQLTIDRMTSGRQVDRLTEPVTEFIKDSRPQAHGSFSHTDNENGPRHTFRDLFS